MGKYTNEELQVLTSQWAKDRFITINGKISTQTLKYIEEAGEMFEDENTVEDIKDAVGDQIVVLSNLANLSGRQILDCMQEAEDLNLIEPKHLMVNLGRLARKVVREDFEDLGSILGELMLTLQIIAEENDSTLNECWNLAYDEIKDRKGKLLENGNFVKE